MVTRLVADLLGQLSLNVREIHSRKPQGYRTKVSDEFRKSKSIILVTSDVSARGVDYPDVSLVVQVNHVVSFQSWICTATAKWILVTEVVVFSMLDMQMGLPSDREQYIHRLGRTGRKGKEGEGVLMLAPWEEYFLSSVKDLPINKSPLPPIDPEAVKKVSLDLKISMQMPMLELSHLMAQTSLKLIAKILKSIEH